MVMPHWTKEGVGEITGKISAPPGSGRFTFKWKVRSFWIHYVAKKIEVLKLETGRAYRSRSEDVTHFKGQGSTYVRSLDRSFVLVKHENVIFIFCVW
jgi:hypothetical protein